MSAPMEPTSVAHMLTARTRWALTAACVKKVILGMASLAQVSFLRRQCWMTSCGPLQPKLQIKTIKSNSVP